MKNTVQLHEVIAKALTIPVEEVVDELSYQSIPEWDSLSHMVLVNEIETHYEITIDTEDVLEMGSVLQVKEIIKKYGLELV